jgi:hypothetical protein
VKFYCASFAIAILVAVAAPARAQIVRPEDLPGWTLVPSVQTIGLYEDNVILNAAPADGTFIRMTPSIEARYRGPLGFFSAGYSLDREVHSDTLRGLDDLARQVGLVSFEAKATERTSLFGTANFLTTERPEEVFDAANLITSIRRTTRLLGSLGVDHAITPTWRLNSAYLINVDDFGDATTIRSGARTIFDRLTTAIVRQKSERTSFAIEHNVRNVVGEERTLRSVTRGVFWSNSLTGRWSRLLAPHLTATVAGGPRLTQVTPAIITPSERTPTEWEWQPELFASLVYKRNEQRLAVEYSRTQTLGYGASGFIDTEGVEARSSWVIARRLRLTVRPGVYRNSLADQHAESYRFDTYASYLVSSWMSLDAVISYKHQDRALALADFIVSSVARSRTRNRIAFGVTLRRAIKLE